MEKEEAKKFELFEECDRRGIKLFRIRSLRNFGNVKKGEIGGFVEKEENLSHFGDAWISGEAEVSGDAWISENARVFEKARVFGDARVFGKARVFENAWISGEAEVSENARVFGTAWIYEKARVSEKARVFENARVFEDAWISGDARVFGDACIFGTAWIYEKARVSGDARVSVDVRVFGDIGKFPLISFTGFGKYDIFILDSQMIIGCLTKSFKEWKNLSDEWVKENFLDDLEWWKKNKEILFSIIDNR